MRNHCLGLLLCISLAAGATMADVWDVQTENDNTALGTNNELVHGSTQTHDLGALAGPAADQDWFILSQPAQSSWDVVVDGTSGDVGPTLGFERFDVSGSALVQASSAAFAGAAGLTRTLRWQNVGSTTALNYVRVMSGSCTTNCGADDGYTIRARESTVNVARWNQSGSQVTVVLTQNTTSQPVAATFFFFASNGTLLSTVSVPALAARNLNVQNLGTISGLTGQSGHIVISHDGGYGALNVKSVALEPSTGFSFDTPGVYKPY